MPRPTLFEYRAWPDDGQPHIETLHCLFGVGLAEIRTDTYILSPARPRWVIVLYGGTEIEVLEQGETDMRVSEWKVLAHSAFPLRRSIVRLLQEAFPMARLSQRMRLPGDVISCLEDEAEIVTVCKRTVQFQRENCLAEFTEAEVEGYRANTFSLASKRTDTIMEALGMLPPPRLPNMDYSAWLQTAPRAAPAIKPARPYRPEPAMTAARLAC